MSLATRGAVLLLFTIAVCALPMAAMLRAESARQENLAATAGVTLLSHALAAHISTHTAAAPPSPQWAARLAERGQALRWAAAMRADGTGVEFCRRLPLPRDAIVGQIAFDQHAPAARPLQLPAGAGVGLYLVTLPADTEGTVFAAIVDVRGATIAVGGSGHLVWAPALAAAVLGFGLHYVLIVRPATRLARVLASTGDAIGRDVPAELAALADRARQTERELAHWRVQAGTLKHSLERRLDERTSDVQRALRQAKVAADTDPLTGLRNRRALERDLLSLFQTAREEAGELSVLWIDVDNFKTFNDTRGHQAGDELIRAAGALLKPFARRAGDLAVRYGGDEFVLVMVGTSLEQAVKAAENLVRMFGQRVRAYGTLETPPAFSIGVASLRRSDPRDATDLLRIADEAMYEAKRGGKGVVAVDKLHRR